MKVELKEFNKDNDIFADEKENLYKFDGECFSPVKKNAKYICSCRNDSFIVLATGAYSLVIKCNKCNKLLMEIG